MKLKSDRGGGGYFLSVKSEYLLKTTNKCEFCVKNDDFYGLLMVFTCVLFENVVTLATRKSL